MAEASGNSRVNPVEKKIFVAALLFTGITTALIGYAAWGVGIAVPTCLPGAQVFDHGSITKHEGKNYEVHFLAKMWGFEPTRVTVPPGSTLDVSVTSKDVTHGFQILGTNVNLMVVPFVNTSSRVHFEKAGVYPIICHEYCGTGHQNMNAVIEVSDRVDDISAEGLPSSDEGRKVAEEKGCLACHSVDGTAGVGPSFKGIWGQKVELSDGSALIVDEKFVKNMILHPANYPVKGFQPLMPELPVTDAEIDQITDYLRGLQ